MDTAQAKRAIAESSFAGHAEALAGVLRAAALGRTQGNGEAGVGNSRIGGVPDLPAGFVWPSWQRGAGRTGESTPLNFLAQIDWSELRGCGLEEVPEAGMLWFFYDAQEQPWGMDPSERESWRVIYAPEPGVLVPTPGPETEKQFCVAELMFTGTVMLPDLEDGALPEEVADPAWDDLDGFGALRAAIRGGGTAPRHQVLGYAEMMQGGMRDVCVAGLSGEPAGTPAARAKAEAAEELDWTLLLQIDSDDAVKFRWGDCGRLYFWIRRQDLAARDFSRVWMVLQCG